MATVPYSGTFGVAQTPSSGIPYGSAAGASAEAFGSQVGQSTQALGKGVEQFGDMLQKHADFYQQRNNQAAADQGFVDGAVENGKVKAWYNALEGKEAEANYNLYVQKLNAVRDNTMANMPNSEAKRMFEREYNRRLVFDIEAGASHAATQQRAYQKISSDSVVKIAKQDSALNPEDQARFDSNLTTIRNKVDEQFPVDVWGKERNELEKRKDVGEAIDGRLTSLSKSHPLAARDLLEKYKDQVDGITYNKLQDKVNQGLIQGQSRIDADKIVARGAGISDDLVERVKKFEGFAPTSQWDYKQNSIGYGTKGKPGETITKDEAESRLRDELGRSAAIVDQAFPNLPSGTRDALVSLTYNSGTDWMKSGLGQKIRAGDFEGAKENFIQYNQAGGQVNPGLVSRRAQEVAMFGGERVNPLADNNQATLMNEAHKRAVELFPDDPRNQATYEDTLQQKIRSHVTTLRTGIIQAQRENRNAVFAEILDPQKLVTNLDQLSPQAQEAFSKLDDVTQSKVRQRFVHNAGVDPNPLTTENYKRWEELDGMARNRNTREQFANINLMDEKLPRNLLQKLQVQQQNIKQTGEQDLRIDHALRIAGPQLKASGVFESTSDDAKGKQFNRFYSQFATALEKHEKEKKNYPNDTEIKEITSKLLVDSNADSWFSRKSYMFEADIPKQFQDAAVAAARANGRMLSPDDIRYLWINRKKPAVVE